MSYSEGSGFCNSGCLPHTSWFGNESHAPLHREADRGRSGPFPTRPFERSRYCPQYWASLSNQIQGLDMTAYRFPPWVRINVEFGATGSYIAKTNLEVCAYIIYASSGSSMRGLWAGRRTISWRALPGAIIG